MKTEEKQIHVKFEGRLISCRIRKSRRARHIGLRILDDGSLGITVPQHRKTFDLDSLLIHHRRWISKNIERNSLEKLRPPFHLEDERSLPLLDYTCRLHIILSPERRSGVEFKPPHLHLQAKDTRFTTLYQMVENWYKKMARNFLRQRIPHWAGILGVSPESVRVKNQRTLWGSCSRKKNLNFNWRIMLLSPQAADYLIIHELLHLKHMDHSKKFWKSVEMFCPDYRKCKRELKEKNHWLKFPEGFNIAESLEERLNSD
ncbi:M48 family metallopeptidase [Acidobacteriota bacterium]